MAEGQNRARGLGRPLSEVLAAIAEHATAAELPALAGGDDVAPPALGAVLTIILAADPTALVGWTSGTSVGVAGEVEGREDGVWALVDDLVEVRTSGRPLAARDDERWHSFVVATGDRAALGIVSPAGSLSAETCALLHTLAANLRRRVR